MMFSQYCRIESDAGGVSCSVRDFLRACRRRLSKQGKTRAMRTQRHEWLRAGLKQRDAARRLYNQVMRGTL